MKKGKTKNKAVLSLFLILAVLVIIVLALALFSIEQENPVEEGPAEKKTVQETQIEETSVEETPQDSELNQNSEKFDFEYIDIGQGLKITDLSVVTGNFPEDGSDEFLKEVLSAEFVNEGEKTLQYAKVNVTIDEEVYTFELSTLPSGERLRAFEVNKKSVQENSQNITAEAENIALFSAEPSCYEDKLEIIPGKKQIMVKNISNEDIENEISVFFKNETAGIYMGGITYRVRIDGLKAGETISGYSSHADEEGTEIMFVTFGN